MSVYLPSGMDEFAPLCPAAMEWRAKWSAVVAEKVALEATRAEADKWQTIATAAQTARDDLKAEVTALRASHRAALREIAALEKAWETGIKAVEYRVLADLRAKVEGLRDEAKADPVGSAVWRTTAYESVLALIEEAQND
jgi:hypothetical protein